MLVHSALRSMQRMHSCNAVTVLIICDILANIVDQHCKPYYANLQECCEMTRLMKQVCIKHLIVPQPLLSNKGIAEFSGLHVNQFALVSQLLGDLKIGKVQAWVYWQVRHWSKLYTPDAASLTATSSRRSQLLH